jgi:hypothetical protein
MSRRLTRYCTPTPTFRERLLPSSRRATTFVSLPPSRAHNYHLLTSNHVTTFVVSNSNRAKTAHISRSLSNEFALSLFFSHDIKSRKVGGSQSHRVAPQLSLPVMPPRFVTSNQTATSVGSRLAVELNQHSSLTAPKSRHNYRLMHLQSRPQLFVSSHRDAPYSVPLSLAPNTRRRLLLTPSSRTEPLSSHRVKLRHDDGPISPGRCHFSSHRNKSQHTTFASS